MLEESGRNAEIIALGIAAGGVAVILYSVLLRRNILAMAAGVIIAAAALVAPMLIRAPPISVVIIQHAGEQVQIKRRDSFYDGTYTARNGKRIAIERERQWGRTATVIINDSDRLITVTGHQYSIVKGAAGRPELLSYLLPMEYRIFPRRIAFTGDDVTGPPKSIQSEGTVDAIIYLAYSQIPYDRNAHGDEAALDSQLTVPSETHRISLNR